MIKINLLDSITDTPRGAAMMEEKVTSPLIQTILLAVTVVGLLVLGAGYDYVSANSAHASAQVELEKQQRINREMLAVNKEQEELQAKTRDIQVRIDAIQKLKAEQKGPGFVLRDITERFNSIPGLYLKSIAQKGTEITIKGESPNEQSVTKFGQTLEFSSGLFTDLHIETVREFAKVGAGPKNGDQAAAPAEGDLARPEVVSFVVKCNYTGAVKKDQPNQPATPNSPATASATAPAGQVAKN
ncbi:MAG TPA: PilN domain-containing protein [Pyrinomonadaceae bacterium]|nr:PilN domain-containing protein [Pyrinomonadaceae bacterium]